ncbi:hypothetical protein ACH5UN_20315, partial [Escherichia coli]
MTQFTQNTAMPSSLWQYWRGLSGWNFYFLANYHFQYANGSLTNTGNATLRILAY